MLKLIRKWLCPPCPDPEPCPEAGPPVEDAEPSLSGAALDHFWVLSSGPDCELTLREDHGDGHVTKHNFKAKGSEGVALLLRWLRDNGHLPSEEVEESCD